MAAKGRLFGSKYGPSDAFADDFIQGANNYAMATLNTGWSGRFQATQNKDIYSVILSWVTVSSPGQVTVRIETDSSGKPSGSLYDANAVATAVVPTAGTQTVTFSSHPTTKLTVGTFYHVVILTTTGGTTQTLRGYLQNTSYSAYGNITLTAADGTTRTNFAEVNASIPVCSLLLDDASEDSMGMAPLNGAQNNINLITSGGNVVVAGLKFVTDATLSVAGVEYMIIKTGTPTANLRFRIYDNSNNDVSSGGVSVSVSTLTNASAKRGQAYFGSLISLSAGTYRAVADGAADTSGSNCWTFRGIQLMNGAVGSGFSMTTAPNISSPVWTDTTHAVAMRLILDDMTVGAATSVAPLFNAGLIA